MTLVIIFNLIFYKFMAFFIKGNPSTESILTNGGFVGLGTNLKIEDGKLDTVSGSENPVDSQLSTTSTNPVQNKVITNRINTIETSLNGKANANNVYTKSESDAKYLTEHQSLDAYLTIQDAEDIYATKQEVQDISHVASAALNDLEERKANASDVSAEIDSKISDFVSKQEIQDMSLVISASLNDLEERKADMDDVLSEINSKISELNQTFYTKTEADDLFVKTNELEEIELVISASLNDLNQRINDLQEDSVSRSEFDQAKSEYYTKEQSDEKYALAETVTDNELVTSSALNDLNSKIENLEERVRALES